MNEKIIEYFISKKLEPLLQAANLFKHWSRIYEFLEGIGWSMPIALIVSMLLSLLIVTLIIIGPIGIIVAILKLIEKWIKGH